MRATKALLELARWLRMECINFQLKLMFWDSAPRDRPLAAKSQTESEHNEDEEEIVLEKSKSDKDEEEQVHDQNTDAVEE